MISSVAILVTGIIAFVTTYLITKLLIPVLRKLKFGQSIKEDGPNWHMHKSGTPTMGGFGFIVGITIATTIGYFSLIALNPDGFPELTENLFLISGVLMSIAFGLIGVLDDYLKVVKKVNEGLKAKHKLLLQILVASIYLAVLYFFGDKSSIIEIPFIGGFDFGFFYYPILGILIVGITNSTNLTDGVDGLCTSMTFVVAIFFMIATTILGIEYINLFAVALAAGCLGFLMHNIYPAKIFMGDTGSVFLGGVLIALAFAIEMEFILFIVGFVYCFESLSVILQVISFKTTGKRIFKMSPIHHHFEMSGWSEKKIVIVFTSVTALLCGVAIFAII